MQVSMPSQLDGKCVELATSPCLFSGVELPSTTPIKHNTCRNSWSSDGTSRGLRWTSMALLLDSDKFLFFFLLSLLPPQRVLVRVWSARTVSKRSVGRSSWAWCRPSSRPDLTRCGLLTPWSPLASALFTFPWRTSFAAR